MSVIYKLDEKQCAHIILDRVEVHNAFDSTVINQLLQSIRRASDEHAKAIILSSKGKHFSAGADLNWMKSMVNNTVEENIRDSETLAALMYSLNFAPMPTLIVLQGASFGGALGLICCCDIAVASEDAKFCLSEVKLGLIPSVISPYVINAIGQRQARRYFITAETFDATEAKAIGLIHRIADDPLAFVDSLVLKLLNNGPEAIKEAKQLIFDVSGKAIEPELLRDTAERIAYKRVSKEGQDGLNAFLSKSPPSWIHE